MYYSFICTLKGLNRSLITNMLEISVVLTIYLFTGPILKFSVMTLQ